MTTRENTHRRLNWLWKHRHNHDGENFAEQIQIIRTTVEEQGDEGSAAGSGAYIHLLSSGQTVTTTPTAISWTGMNSVLGLLHFAAPTFPTTEATVQKPGYYDVGVMVGFDAAVSGATVTVVRVRDNEVTVFPPTSEAGVWAVDYQTQTFSDVAKGIEFRTGDSVKVYVSAGASVGLEFAALSFELIDRLTGSSAPPSGYRDLILSGGPIAYWRLGEPSGSTMIDSTGNGHVGSYSGATLGVTGLIDDPDTAASWAGSGAAGVTTANLSQFDISVITLEAWIQTSSTAVRQILTRDDGVNRVFQFRTNTVVQFLLLRDGDGASHGTLSGVTNIADGQPHHVVLTYDGSTARLFVDGTLEASPSLPAGLQLGSTAPVRVAARSGGAFSDVWTGVLDEIVVYGRVLPAGEVEEHYNVGSGI
jgi:hypothetical protein